MSVHSNKKNKESSTELQEVIGLTVEKLHELLIQCCWRLMDAYAITGHEHYLKQAENLRNLYSRIDHHLRQEKASSSNHQIACIIEDEQI